MMDERWTFLQLSIEVLSKVDRPLTPVEIWKSSEDLGFTKYVKTNSKTPWVPIKAAIVSNILKNPIDTPFIKYDESEEVFGLKFKKYQVTKEMANPEEPQLEEVCRYSEKQLHPLLSTFVFSNDHFMCSTKTIVASGGKRGLKNFKMWSYPDIVGLHYSDDIHELTWDIQKHFKGDIIRIFSFELKKSLAYDNLKSCFFQAVSNSSWAHEGYLVTAEIVEDSLFKDELRNLAKSFGIGVIILNINSIHESEIFFPAKRKDTLNFSYINELIKVNSDFKRFMEAVHQTCTEKGVRPDGIFDKVLDEIELQDYTASLTN